VPVRPFTLPVRVYWIESFEYPGFAFLKKPLIVFVAPPLEDLCVERFGEVVKRSRLVDTPNEFPRGVDPLRRLARSPRGSRRLSPGRGASSIVRGSTRGVVGGNNCHSRVRG
jgi:hypothetical protein